ncbi:HWE histidine kinase domain-containing protein [Rhizobium mongolense]|uniref:HWE histidine kinase domain-containing protein n=1 Tax=Rhizobium mongolense TaxID=57676 RepID=UPI0034A3C77E
MQNEPDRSGSQKAAEAEVEGFKQELGPFVVAAETTRMAMVFTDAKKDDQPIIFANDSFLSLTGFTRNNVLGETIRSFLAPNSDTHALEQLGSSFEGASDGDAELGLKRHDGSIIPTSVFVSPVRDERGEINQNFVSFVDLTKHRQEQEHLRFLLDELNHRTQNTLATVLAIIGQTLRGMADDDVIAKLEKRVLALSEVNSLLGDENWDRVGLRDVLDRILEPFRFNKGHNSRFALRGENVRLRPKAALTFAMVFHELATNAVQYGALSERDAGLVEVEWSVEPLQGGQLRLCWRESGGPPVAAPQYKGFGSRLIERGLAQELNGSVHLSFDHSGLICEIKMPAQGDTPVPS